MSDAIMHGVASELSVQYAHAIRCVFIKRVHADAHGLPVIVARDDGVLNAVCDESRTTNDAKSYISSASNTEGKILRPA